MTFRTCRYLWGLGLKNLWHHRVYTAAAVLTMSSCMFLFGIFFLGVLNVDSILTRTEEAVSVAVFFDEDVAPERVEEIGAAIRQRPEVLRTTYTSAEDAWNTLRESYFEDSELLEGIFEDDNPLAASGHYQVYIRGVEQQEAFVEYVESVEGVRKVTHSADTVRALMRMKSVVSRLIAASVGLLLIISVLLIHNTLSVGIEAQREKTHVMRLMGAREEFVRVPFIVEAFVMAIAGVGIPLALLFVCYRWGSSMVSAELLLSDGSLNLLPVETVFPRLIRATLLLGIVTGAVGAVSVMGKLRRR